MKCQNLQVPGSRAHLLCIGIQSLRKDNVNVIMNNLWKCLVEKVMG